MDLTTPPSLEVLLRVRDSERPRIEAELARHGLSAVQQPTTASVPRLVMLDPDAMGSEALGRVQRAALAYPRTPVLLVTGAQERSLLAAFVEVPNVLGLVARDSAEGERELMDALELLVQGPRFGLDRLVPEGTEVLSRELAASVERDELLDAAEGFLVDRGIRARMANHARDAIEELITNAVYDAPTDATGQRLYAEIDRRNAIFLPSAARPRLDLAVHGSRVVAVMTDPHGSLDVATVRRFLAMGLRGDLSDKPGGAGLGFARVFGLVDRLVIQIEARKRTEIAFMLESASARRDPASRPTGFIAYGP